ncbi:MAG: RNA polymerase sigma factor [Gaiellaceae bacterium]
MTVAGQNESELIRRARAGDTRAYCDLVREHQAHAYRLARYIGGASDAEEVTQLAFIKAYDALGRFELGRPFRPWLLQIVVNEAKSARRRESRLRNPPAEAFSLASAASSDVPYDEALRASEREELIAAIGRLSPKHREVVICRYLLELSEEETARTLGLPLGTVKSRLSRGLERLEDDLRSSAAPSETTAPARSPASSRTYLPFG